LHFPLLALKRAAHDYSMDRRESVASFQMNLDSRARKDGVMKYWMKNTAMIAFDWRK
jgi:hypothetical protein